MYKTLGELALHENWLSEKELYQCLIIQNNKRLAGVSKEESLLGTILIEEGFFTEKTLRRLLAEQSTAPEKSQSPDTTAKGSLSERNIFKEDKESEGELETIKEETSFVDDVYNSTLKQDKQESLTFSSPLAQEERYEVLKELGKGGMGVVELVRDNILGREVARKRVLLKHLNLLGKRNLSQKQEQSLWRFYKETSITAILEHPNIIPLYEIQIEENGHFQFTMRKVEGENLRTYFQQIKAKKRKYDETQLLSIFLKICDAISYAHNQGVIHRDLKPENIMVGEFGEVYVMDWGIARILKENETELHQELLNKKIGVINLNRMQKESIFQTVGGLGTPGYIAPEQNQEASKATPQSDIYALGKILKECYTFTSPAEELRLMLKEIEVKMEMESFLPGLSKKYESSLPPDIKAIVQKAKATDQSQRYKTVQEMAEEIKRYQRNEWVHARENKGFHAQLDSLKKWLLRNRIVVSLFLALLVGVLILSFYNSVQLEQNYQHHLKKASEQQMKSLNLRGTDKPSLIKKIKLHLAAMNWLNSALTLKPAGVEAEKKKLKLGQELLAICYKTKDFPLASFIAKELSQLSNIKDIKSEALLAEVEKEQEKKAEQEIKQLQNWESKFLKRELEENELEDILYNISQFTEEATFQYLLVKLDQAAVYYQSEIVDSNKDLFYHVIVEGLGRLGNQKAVPFLAKILVQRKKQYLNEMNPPIIRIEDWMIVLTQALGNLQADQVSDSYAFLVKKLRMAFGEGSYYWNKTKIAYRKLVPGAIRHYSKLLERSPQEATLYFHRGSDWVELNKYKKAIVDYKKAIQLNPKYAEAYQNLGNTKRLMKDYKGALVAFNKAIQLKPELDIIYNNRGNTKADLKDFSGAIEDYNQAINLNPKLTEAYNNRGNVKVILKDFQGAISDYNVVLKIYPQNSMVYSNRGNAKKQLNNFQGALFDYNQAIKWKSKTPIFYNNRGSIRVRLNDLQGALSDLNYAIKLEPGFFEAYKNRGNTKAELKDYLGAVHDFNEALKINPKEGSIYHNRGLAKIELKQYKQAFVDLSKAKKLTPQNAAIYIAMGDLKAKLEKYEEAILEYNQVIQINPQKVTAYKHRGNCYFRLNQHQKALIDYNKSIKLDPNEGSSYLNRGTVKYELKNYKGAIEDYNQALKLNFKKVTVYLHRGNAYFELKNFQKAVADFEQVLKLDPKNETVLINRGNANFNLKRFQEALTDYNKALKLEPKNAYIYYKRATTKNSLKDYEGAILDYSQAIRWDSKYVDAYMNRGIAQFDTKKFKEAIKDFTQVIKLAPQNAHAYNNRANANNRLGNYQIALKDYDKAIQVNSQIDRFYFQRGNLKSNIQDYQGAISDYKQAVLVNPKNFRAYFNLGMRSKELGQYEQAILFYEKGLQLQFHPQIFQFFQQVLLQEAVQRYRKKEYQKAKEYLLRLQKHTKPGSLKATEYKKMLQQIEKQIKKTNKK